MLDHLEQIDARTDRKLRLSGLLPVCRRLWHLLTDENVRLSG